MRRTAAAVALSLPLLAGCTTTGTPEATETADQAAVASAAPTSGVPTSATAAPTSPTPEPAPMPDPGPEAAALALAPADAAYLTVTDWAAIKERLGAADLTSESIQTDTIEFWRSVGTSTVLLTDGVLREENSRLRLRYAVTQDDALWEVRWADDEVDDERTAGLALRLRDDLDLDGLERAVQDEVPGVEGASVLRDGHLLLRGEATGDVLADRDEVAALLEDEGESRLAVPGCLSWPTALGVDATVEEQDNVVGAAPVEDLRSPRAWGMSFTGREATLTLVHEEGVTGEEARADAAARVALAQSWPTTESVGWGDALGLPPGLEGDPYAVEEDGRVVTSIDYRVVNTTAAATVALSGLVPGAVCAEVDWLAEPTGL
ncbi:hypothetical protein SGUI_2536 [Serinicoccus hydrothermalis]|uniref:Uncharacterized protein n=1 Tax=Serinicoccus hydrothermalis TaxID=1758689 RepID=A0A1B1NES3_9MICO|nr:hypothetical protein [Serinicoccus hydrothermalis]ANS79932.1 hypothetical protein SGUI_2536 [Serinicoccus hydrothermalis]